jgi:hypothetical protein
MDHDFYTYTEESPTEIHRKNCDKAPDSHPTGDATAEVVADPERFEEQDEKITTDCICLAGVK